MAALLLGLLAAAPANAAPYRPADDATVLERLPTAGDPAARNLRRLHAALARAPDNLQLALEVARRDIEEGRQRSDPRYNGYAEAALTPFLATPDPLPAVLVMRATLRQSIHDFAGARADLERVIAADPRNGQAWLTRAVIDRVEGDYPAARKDCQAVASLTIGLVTATCLASIESVNGHATAAYDELHGALDNAPPTATPPVRIWALTNLAETAARRGDAAAADASYRAALAVGVPDGYLLGSYADFLLDQDRPAEVVTLLRDSLRIDPLLLRVALAEQRLKAPELAAHVADLDERFDASRQRGDTIHRREEARFMLDLRHDPDEALRLAIANWAVQREPWDARVLLAAASAAKAPDKAKPVIDFVAAAKLEDPQVQHLVEAVR